MRNKVLMSLMVSIVAVLSFVSSPPPARAQTEPTIIYETEFEDDPGMFGDEYYGNDTYWSGEEWDAGCGVDSTGCIYTPGNLLSGDDALALMDYAQFPTDVDLTGNPAPPGCVINFVEFDLYYRTDTEGGTDVSEIYVVGDNDGSAGLITPVNDNDYSFRDDFDIAGLPGAVEGEFFHVGLNLSNTAEVDSWAIRWAIVVEDIPGDPPVYDLEVRVDNLVVWCDYHDDLVRPLTLEDEYQQWEMFDKAYVEDVNPLTTRYAIIDQTVYAFSDGFGLPVHAAIAGVITDMDPLNPYEHCVPEFLGLILTDISTVTGNQGTCSAHLPEEITNEGIPEIPFDGDHFYRLNLVDAWRVVLTATDGSEFVYFAANADQYVEIGTEVSSGCVLGETIQLLHLTTIELESVSAAVEAGQGGFSGGIGGSVTFRSALTNVGVTFIIHYVAGDATRLLPSLTRYPTSDSPCGSDPRFANCLETDPQLRQVSAWTTQGSVTFDNPGFTLISSNALIKEVMALEADVEYGLTVEFQVLEPEPRVELKLGQTVETTTILESPGQIVTVSIAADLHAADLTEFWTVRVRNVSNVSVKIVSICVSSGEIVGQPTACYFRNDSFDQGVTNWDVSEGVEQRDGSITVPSLDTFAQEATLPADEPDTTFQLYVDVYIWYEPGTTISRTDVTSTVQMEYQFPDSGASWETLVGPSSSSTTTFSEFVVAAERQGVTVGTVSFQGFIEIDADTTGTITIRPTVTTAVEGVLGVGIDRACLRGDFGVDQIDDTIGVECQEVTRPLDQLLSSWTVWLWRKFDRFFQCDMMIVHRQIRNTTTEIYRLTGWSIRYWKAMGFYHANWMGNELFPWLNGHLGNIAMGNVAIIQSTSGSCGSASFIDSLISFFTGACGTGLFDVLNSLINGILGTINLLIGALYNLINLLITSVFTIIYTALVFTFSLLSQLISLLSAIITGWNSAPPAAIPGLPSCETDPSTNYLCLPFYILNNTIFSEGEEGQLLILLLVSYGSFELIVSIISKIRETFMSVTEAL